MRDVISNMPPEQLISPVILTGPADGASVDLKGYDGALIAILIGESGDTLSGAVRIECELEESSDNSEFTDVDDSDLVNEVSGTNSGCFGLIDDPAEDDQIFFCQYTGDQRYVRPVANLIGTHSTGTPIAAFGMRLGKRTLPVS